jgi:SAM-dependent methyltransferase
VAEEVTPLVVTDEAFPYLVLQQGRLDHLKHDRRAWEAAYNAKMAELMRSIEPHLPDACNNVLDIGGGMGGIDALLARRFGPDCEVTILDGEADLPVMTLHRKTFSHKDVCKAFLEANGVRPERFSYVAPDLRATPGACMQPFDLVVSFGSWCFHYPPEEYLAFVKRTCRPGATLIIELRLGGTYDWQADLLEAFDPVGVAGASDKFIRVVYAAR